MKPPYESKEFEALQMKYQDHTELLRVMTGIDLKLFFGYITIQLALGAFIMKSPDTVTGLAGYLIAIDVVLAVVALVLLYFQYKRRKEVTDILKNINKILGFDDPGIYHESLSVNVVTETRFWFPIYIFGIAAGLIAFSLLALKAENFDQDARGERFSAGAPESPQLER